MARILLLTLIRGGGTDSNADTMADVAIPGELPDIHYGIGGAAHCVRASVRHFRNAYLKFGSAIELIAVTVRVSKHPLLDVQRRILTTATARNAQMLSGCTAAPLIALAWVKK